MVGRGLLSLAAESSVHHGGNQERIDIKQPGTSTPVTFGVCARTCERGLPGVRQVIGATSRLCLRGSACTQGVDCTYNHVYDRGGQVEETEKQGASIAGCSRCSGWCETEYRCSYLRSGYRSHDPWCGTGTHIRESDWRTVMKVNNAGTESKCSPAGLSYRELSKA